jgi:hypothetical protein
MTPLSPHEQVIDMMFGAILSNALVSIGELGVADAIPAEQTRSIEDIAAATGCHERALYRTLRYLASNGVFHEHDDRCFEHTALSLILRSDHPQSVLPVICLSQRLHVAHPHFLHSLRTEQSALESAWGEPMFSYLAKRPDDAAVFDAGMPALHGDETAPMLDAYDFSAIDTLMDVGGGGGTLIAETLRRHSGMRGILFDLDHVVERARPYLVDQGVADRCETCSGSFFEEVPSGADAIVMRHIVHDFLDDDAEQIMSNCRSALPGDGRVLVVEAVVPHGNEPSPAKLMDMGMMLYPGGMERTVDEFSTLFEASGFEMTSVTPTASMVSVIEGRPV